MESEPEASPALSLAQAESLIREIVMALERPDIGESLDELVLAADGDRQLMIQLVMPFVNRVQAQVLSRHGFEPSSAGVVAFGRAIEPHKASGRVRELLAKLKARMMPLPEQARLRKAQRRDREQLGLQLHEVEPNGAMCWSAPSSAVAWEPEPPPSERARLGPVAGGWLVRGVLSAAECTQIIRLAEAMGFEPSQALTTAESTQWWSGPETASVLFGRLRPHLPPAVHGSRLCGINLRLRLYKYTPGGQEQFLPHFDDGWEGSVMAGEEDCLAHWDQALEAKELDEDRPLIEGLEQPEIEQRAAAGELEERRWASRMSCLLYLNSVEHGGATSFWQIDPAFSPNPEASYEQNIKAASSLSHSQQPEQGSALCFYHGAHEQSPLYSDEPLDPAEGAPKYVIRTDIMYLSPAE